METCTQRTKTRLTLVEKDVEVKRMTRIWIKRKWREWQEFNMSNTPTQGWSSPHRRLAQWQTSCPGQSHLVASLKTRLPLPFPSNYLASSKLLRLYLGAGSVIQVFTYNQVIYLDCTWPPCWSRLSHSDLYLQPSNLLGLYLAPKLKVDWIFEVYLKFT